MNTIFVQIPAYRDPELHPTINDLYKKAKYPHNINIGICLQVCPDDDVDCMLKQPDAYPGMIRIQQFHYSQSKGLGWARSIAQSLWQNETYTLQIDSHMRFEQDWDEILINTSICAIHKNHY